MWHTLKLNLARFVRHHNFVDNEVRGRRQIQTGHIHYQIQILIPDAVNISRDRRTLSNN